MLTGHVLLLEDFIVSCSSTTKHLTQSLFYICKIIYLISIYLLDVRTMKTETMFGFSLTISLIPNLVPGTYNSLIKHLMKREREREK